MKKIFICFVFWLIFSQQLCSDDNHFQTLRKSVYDGKIGILRHEIKNGLNVNICDSNGTSILMYAANAGNREMVKLLVRNGANVNAENVFGYTALLQAAQGSLDYKVMEFLLESGADVNHPTKQGVTALMMISGCEFCQTIDLELVTLLIEKGANVLAIDDQGNDALLYSHQSSFAISKSHQELAQLLIGHGAAPVKKNKNNETLLMYAAENGNYHTVKYLADSGMELSIAAKDKNGDSALSRLKKRKLQYLQYPGEENRVADYDKIEKLLMKKTFHQ